MRPGKEVVMNQSRGAQAPTLVSMLVCDQVIDDKLSNKKSAIGIFNTVMVPRMPTAIHQMAILASLTELVGPAALELRLVRDSDNDVLFRGQGTVEAPNPLAVVDLVFGLHGVRVPDAGQYAFELWSGSELLGRRRFQVVVRTPPSGPPPDALPPQMPEA
jgi:hypothetical protein